MSNKDAYQSLFIVFNFINLFQNSLCQNSNITITQQCDPNSDNNNCLYGCCRENRQSICCTQDQYNRAVAASLLFIFVIPLLCCCFCCLVTGAIYAIIAHNNKKKRESLRQTVFFNANQRNIPLYPNDHSQIASPNDIGLNMDTKPGNSSGIYNPSFLVPDDLPTYNSTYLSPPNYENASVILNTNSNTQNNSQNPSNQPINQA